MQKMFNILVIIGLIILSIVVWFSIRPHQHEQVEPTITTQQDITPRRTMILDGNGDPLVQINAQNAPASNGVVTVSVDTLEQDVRFGNYSGHFRWNATDNVIEYTNTNGVVWLPVGSGGNNDYALYNSLDDHSMVFAGLYNPSAYYAFDTWSSLQIAFLGNLEDRDTAESFFMIADVDYSCTLVDFGKDAMNKLYLTVGTVIDTVCESVTYQSSTTIPSLDVPHPFIEFAVQALRDSSIRFYADGFVNGGTSIPSTWITSHIGNQWMLLCDGVRGRCGPVRMWRDGIDWPLTGTKEVSDGGQSSPGLELYIPYIDGSTGARVVTDVIGGYELFVDTDAEWETVRGGY